MMSTKGAHSATVMSSRPSPRRAGVPPNARESRLLISSSSRNGFHSDSSFIGFHRVNALIKLFLSILRRKFTCPRPRWPPSFTSGGPASNSSRTAFRFSQNPCQGQQGDASSSHLRICLKTGFVCFNNISGKSDTSLCQSDKMPHCQRRLVIEGYADPREPLRDESSFGEHIGYHNVAPAVSGVSGHGHHASQGRRLSCHHRRLSMDRGALNHLPHPALECLNVTLDFARLQSFYHCHFVNVEAIEEMERENIAFDLGPRSGSVLQIVNEVAAGDFFVGRQSARIREQVFGFHHGWFEVFLERAATPARNLRRARPHGAARAVRRAAQLTWLARAPLPARCARPFGPASRTRTDNSCRLVCAPP